MNNVIPDKYAGKKLSIIENCVDLSGMPYMYNSIFTFKYATLGEVDILLLYQEIKTELSFINKVHKCIEERYKIPVVIVLIHDQASMYTLKYLTQNDIPWILEDTSYFLPMLGDNSSFKKYKDKYEKEYSKRYKYPYNTLTAGLYSKDIHLFNVAKEVSKIATYRGVHIGCIAVQNHRIISSGYNSNKSAPIQKRANLERFKEDGKELYEHFLHAEINCIKPLIKQNNVNFKKVKLYIYRSTKSDIPALSRPCASCLKIIKENGIRWIYYTGDSYDLFKEDLYNGLTYKLV